MNRSHLFEVSVQYGVHVVIIEGGEARLRDIDGDAKLGGALDALVQAGRVAGVGHEGHDLPRGAHRLHGPAHHRPALHQALGCALL